MGLTYSHRARRRLHPHFKASSQGIFVKGKNIRVPAGTEYMLFTRDDSGVRM